MYLVEVDDGLPEVNLLLVEVPHTDLSEVTRVVLQSIVRCCTIARFDIRSHPIHVGTVMVLASS